MYSSVTEAMTMYCMQSYLVIIVKFVHVLDNHNFFLVHIWQHRRSWNRDTREPRGLCIHVQTCNVCTVTHKATGIANISGISSVHLFNLTAVLNVNESIKSFLKLNKCFLTRPLGVNVTTWRYNNTLSWKTVAPLDVIEIRHWHEIHKIIWGI